MDKTLNDVQHMEPIDCVKKMLENDRFSQWMELKIHDVSAGYCKLSYRFKEDMMNGVGTGHGGVIFSACDSAFAFAANSHGVISVALDVSISFVEPAKLNDLLTVEAVEEYCGRKTALYKVVTTNQNGQKICVFQGTVYRTGKSLLDINIKKS